MAKQAHETRTVAVPTTEGEWRSLLDLVRLDDARVVVEENGRPIGALVSADDYQWLGQRDVARRELFEAIDEVREAFKDVPIEEIEREVAKAIREVRAEDDAAQRRPTSAA
jgi:PHD/YefM family antitoxin component YafN of YafNO toxin-antitoxin module